MFKLPERPRGPTDEELVVVADVYEKTGILTVKDATTGHFVKPRERCGGVPWQIPYQHTPDYGIPFQRPAGAGPGDSAFATGGDSAESKYFVRAIYKRFDGSKKFPQGLACSGVEVWTQDNFFVETDKFTCTNFRFDISPEEIDRLAAYSNDVVYVTDELWNQKAAEAKARREGALETQTDPVGAMAKALGPSLGEVLKGIIEQANAKGPSDELLAELKRLRAENEKLKAGAAK